MVLNNNVVVPIKYTCSAQLDDGIQYGSFLTFFPYNLQYLYVEPQN